MKTNQVLFENVREKPVVSGNVHSLLRKCCIDIFFALLSCRQQVKPNILFILTDDQGSWTLSSQSFPNAYTPNLDKLAAKGVVMRNAFFVSAVCSASRAALISGRYPSEAGVMGVVSTGSKNGIDTSLVLWPEILRDAGYQTALVGKWHLGHANEFHFPEQNGYQLFSGFLQNGSVSKDPEGQYSGVRCNLFDLSMRVPFIIRWPGMVEPGSEIEKTVTFLDIYPTLLEMTGIRQPDDLLLRGNSFVPLLQGLDASWDNTFYAQMSLTNTKIRCIQTPEWKYVYEFADTTKNELYHLSKDPREYINLVYSKNPLVIEKSEELHWMLFQRLKEINDPVMNKVIN